MSWSKKGNVIIDADLSSWFVTSEKHITIKTPLLDQIACT
jgi:hypothetical protein